MPIQEAGAEISNDNKISSSMGSRSHGEIKGSSTDTISRGHSKFRLLNHYSDGRTCPSSFNMDEYLNLNQAEDLLFERLRQRQRIEYGGIILCRGQSYFIA
ncbi:uncharacterized protein LOC121998642 isoform X2 [Zingiber officinale]|uniref:uncharacterized protein LOC121998642 isoform X2 n=1 Tax=Zingiber officinale TaxID=94328 RepID=UPI001C4D70F8|nr:uncharacterized protein LOC121998642 isoform X2 [Zingiber officinale]